MAEAVEQKRAYDSKCCVFKHRVMSVDVNSARLSPRTCSGDISSASIKEASQSK